MSEKLKISINKREMKKEIKNIEESDYFYSLKTQIKKIKSGALEKVFHGEEERYETILNNELGYSDDLISGLFSERFRFDKYQSIIGTVITGEISKPKKVEIKEPPKIEKTTSIISSPVPKKVISKFGAKRDIKTTTPSDEKVPVKIAPKSETKEQLKKPVPESVAEKKPRKLKVETVEKEKPEEIIKEPIKVEPELEEKVVKSKVKEVEPKKKAKAKKKVTKKKTKKKKKITKKEPVPAEKTEEVKASEEKLTKVKKVTKTKKKKTTKRKKTTKKKKK